MSHSTTEVASGGSVAACGARKAQGTPTGSLDYPEQVSSHRFLFAICKPRKCASLLKTRHSEMSGCSAASSSAKASMPAVRAWVRHTVNKAAYSLSSAKHM